MTVDAPVVLALVPVVAVATYLGAAWARRVRVGRAARWSSETAARARAAGRRTPAALGLAAAAAGIALAGPRWGEERVVTETRGLSLVIAMDISRSMLAQDVAPSRLHRALREARRLAQDLDGDRLGLIAYAGASYVLSPLSADGSALLMFLDALDPDVASAGGSALAPMLRQGGALLHASSDVADRVLVVFTDGEGHDSLGGAVEEARRLRAAGVHLVLVAEGGTVPVPIPAVGADGQETAQRDAEGNEVRTQRRDDILSALADAAEGSIVAADLPDQAGAVRDLVAGFRRGALAEAQTTRGRSRAWIPLSVAVLLLVIQTWTRPTAALVSLLLMFGLGATPGVAAAQARPRVPAQRAWDAGDASAAAAAWAADAARRADNDTAWLNAGTAALAAGQNARARQALARAAASLDPVVRFRALFNLGALSLRLAGDDPAGREGHLDDAERAYREALLLQPRDTAAKWNLELAINRQRDRSGGGGQRDDPQRPPQQGDNAGRPPPPRPQSAGLSAEQAERILQSIGQEELATRRDRVERTRRAAPAGVKDW